MGANQEKTELARDREAEIRGWQFKGNRFNDYISRLDKLAEFTDSTSDEFVQARMQLTERDKSGFTPVKELVSKKKIRFQNDFFNLDLAYITQRIIAMGFPAVGVQRMYRNSRDDVISFLDTYHPTHYKLYNLCAEPDRYYTNKDFPGVSVELFPVKDHQATNILMLFLFCLDAYYYARENTTNVIVVHCKAGKGRTGMMICSFLLFTGLKLSVDEALIYYGKRRARDGVGVSIPSQIRSIEYFDQFLLEEFGEMYRGCIDFILSKQEATARKIKARNSRPFRLVSMRLFPCSLQFQKSIFVHINTLEKDEDQKVNFEPKNLEPGVVDFVPTQELVVSGDICVDLNTSKLTFSLWLNAYCSQDDLAAERLYGPSPDNYYSSTFCFRKNRPNLSSPNRWPEKSLSDFDQKSGSLSKQVDLKLMVVFSGAKLKSARLPS